MKTSLVAAVAFAAFFATAGTLSLQAGENDLGLKASGNGLAGTAVKPPHVLPPNQQQ